LQRTLNVRLEEAHDEIRGAWQSVIERLVDTPTPSVSSTPSRRFNIEMSGGVLSEMNSIVIGA
jgi:hypothetical protein